MLKYGQTYLGVGVIVVPAVEVVAPNAVPDESSALSVILQNSQENGSLRTDTNIEACVCVTYILTSEE
jgi:hypothetical protein